MPYLDEQSTDRDYLYGRILAVYDNIERWALRELNKGKSEPTYRQTNAMKLQ